ncbi:MAG: hypothetical protein QMC70_07570 [Bacteroidia bacterium]|jgi:hypothetical protein|tara:strand:+ start:1370 stop:2017 length:648 start_codon:yes stop_codon:yes gene_type:complete
MKKTIILVGVMLCIYTSYAQKKVPQPDDNIKKYLDDGRLMDATGNLKIYVSSFAYGFLEAGYEQKINDKFSVEATAALALSPGATMLLAVRDAEINFLDFAPEFQSGSGFSVSGRAYKSMGAITDMQYRAFTYSNRIRKYDLYEKRTHNLYLTTGAKKLIRPAISLEFSASVGASFYKYDLPNPVIGLLYNDAQTQRGTSLYYAVKLGLGYYFKY